MEYQELFAIAVNATVRAGKKIMEVYDTAFKIEYKSDSSPLTTADKLANNIIVDALKSTQIPILSEESKAVDFVTRKHWDTYWLVDPLDGTKEFISHNGEFTVNIALIKNRRPVLGIIYAPVTSNLYYGISCEGAYRLTIQGAHLQNGDFEKALALKEKLPLCNSYNEFRVVASRSHMNTETLEYVDNIRKSKPDLVLVSKGSSLKLCLIAEGSADLYPRFGPTMEWDIAAGHAIVIASGGKLYQAGDGSEFLYNKENLLNPNFIAEKSALNPKS